MLGLIAMGGLLGLVVLWVINAGGWLAGVVGFRDLFAFGRLALICVVCCYCVVFAGCLRC